MPFLADKGPVYDLVVKIKATASNMMTLLRYYIKLFDNVEDKKDEVEGM
jgi:hypothetical protein